MKFDPDIIQMIEDDAIANGIPIKGAQWELFLVQWGYDMVIAERKEDKDEDAEVGG